MTTQTEDTGVVETTEVTPVTTETTPEVIQEEDKVETETTTVVEDEKSTEEQSAVDELVNKLTISDMDDLLKAITDGIEGDSEDVPTGPVHFENKEETSNEEDSVLTEEEMVIIEQELISLDTEVEALKSQLIEKDKIIEEEKQKQNDMEEAWSKIVSDPIIGKIAMQIATGKEVNTSEIILKHLKKEVDSMPNLNQVEQVSVKKEIKSNAQRIYETKTM